MAHETAVCVSNIYMTVGRAKQDSTSQRNMSTKDASCTQPSLANATKYHLCTVRLLCADHNWMSAQDAIAGRLEYQPDRVTPVDQQRNLLAEVERLSQWDVLWCLSAVSEQKPALAAPVK